MLASGYAPISNLTTVTMMEIIGRRLVSLGLEDLWLIPSK